MTIVQSLKYEFFVIMGILFLGATFGSQECKNFWTLDIGTFISVIGAAWIVGSFFRLYPTLEHNYASLVAAVCVFVLGFALSEYGIFTSLILVGAVAIYFAYMSFPLSPTQATIMFAIAIPLIILGLILRPFDIPTDPKKYYNPIKRDNITWNAVIYYDGGQESNLTYIVGSEEKAYKETRSIVTKWKAENPGHRISEIQVRIDGALYYDASWQDGYCTTHELFKLNKFPKNRIPKYCDLTDLEG